MIKEIIDKDVERALDLVNRVFSEFVAVDYSEQGRNTFESYLENKLQEVSTALQSGDKKMWAYYQDDEILGVIATQNTSHISLMFVDKQYHGQGIARQLFRVVCDELGKNKSVTQITVNSSPYAMKAYEHLGFTKTGEQQENNGIIFIPMARPI
ncbi:MAG: GNAT family N-acetyltransferase [Oscillospiraceae bacterium]|nr:GNAT family N-acetyltransferase [Oscillospiraceae bacterium]